MVLHFSVRKLYDTAQVSFLLVLVVSVMGMFEKWRGGKLAASAKNHFEQEFDTDILEGSQDNFLSSGERGLVTHRTGGDERNVRQGLSYSVESQELTPIIKTFSDAAKAFGYCARRMARYATEPEDEQTSEVAKTVLLYCADVANTVKATVSTCDLVCNDTALKIINEETTEPGFDHQHLMYTKTVLPLYAGCLREDYRYSDLSDECYKLYDDHHQRWEDAKMRCEHDKAHLATINSRVEANILGELAREAQEFCHIGVYKDDKSGWLTIHGQTLVDAAGYEDVWSGRQPRPGAKWRYGAVNDMARIVSLDGVDIRPYICEMPPSK